MFAPYTPIDRCIGKELVIRTGALEYTGLLAGVYTIHGLAVMVVTPMKGGGTEVHIPLPGSVVTVKNA